MKQQIILFIILFFIMIYSGCETEVYHTLRENTLIGYCVLNNFHENQTVEVFRTFVPTEYVDLYPQENQVISDADVQLKHGEDRIFFEFYKTAEFLGNSYYKKDFKIVPGEKYEIHISHPEYGEITANTQMPGKFQILKPENGMTVSETETVEICFSESAGAAGYLIYAEISFVGEESSEDGHVYCEAFTEPLELTNEQGRKIKATILISNEAARRFLIYPQAFREVLKSAYQHVKPRCKIFISALDEHFYRFYCVENGLTFRDMVVNAFFTNPHTYSNFQNGYGLFAATLMDSVEIEIPKSFYVK